MSEPSKHAPREWFQVLRRILRGVRWCSWLVGFTIVGIFVYLALNDLPDFIKQKLQTQLRTRGVDMEIAHLRWDWFRGFVAEDVRFGSSQMATNGPQLTIKEVELKLEKGALRHFQFNRVGSLVLTGGSFNWQLSDPGQPVETLSLTNLQAQLILQTNDQWNLAQFTAGFAGVTLHLQGSVTNASAVRDWEIFQGKGKSTARPEELREHLRQIVETADVVSFAKPPDLNVQIHGDARDPQSFSSLITLEAEGATTPWGTLNHGQLNARLIPSGTNHSPMQLEFKLQGDTVDTRWGSSEHFRAELHAVQPESLTNLVQARLDIFLASVDTPWVQATNGRFSAQWTHSLTNPIPAAGTLQVRLTDARSPWATADEVRLDGTLAPATNGPVRADASWGWWANLKPCDIDWKCRMTEIRAGEFESKELACAGSWRAPELNVTNLHTEMYRGQLLGNAGMDVSTRLFHFSCSSDFDVQKANAFLTEDARGWFQKQALIWEKPPVAHASGSLVLPPWDERKPNWREEVLPTFAVQGDFAIGNSSYRQVPINSAQSHFAFTNLVWTLPDLVVARPEGSVKLALESDEKTQDYHCQIKSDVDLKVLRNLLPTNAQTAMDWVQYVQTPVIDAELWGNWKKPERIGGKGHVALTNFSFRGESANSLVATLAYTNLFVLVTDARVERPEGYATADAVGVDIEGRQAFLTNGFGNMEPLVFLHALGPKITALIEPYHFAKPPAVHAFGVIPLSDDISMADIHFNIDGGPYVWTVGDPPVKFHSEHVKGTVDWVAETLHVDLPQAEFYGGTLAGTADFDFTRKNGANFKFDMSTSGANLHRLMSDLYSETNKLEGTLSGRLNITNANTEFTKESWYGNGHVELKDGLIWEIPIFGIFSSVLDGISPDLGKSRVSEAKGTFTIARSVIHSDDFEARSPTLRISLHGSVGFDTKVDATEEAEVRLETPLVGPVVNTFLIPFSKAFESKITGTLKNPKSEIKNPVSRWMVKPFTFSWKMMKDLWPGESTPAPVPQFSTPPDPASTNIAPIVPQPEVPTPPK